MKLEKLLAETHDWKNRLNESREVTALLKEQLAYRVAANEIMLQAAEELQQQLLQTEDLVSVFRNEVHEIEHHLSARVCPGNESIRPRLQKVRTGLDQLKLLLANLHEQFAEPVL